RAEPGIDASPSRASRDQPGKQQEQEDLGQVEELEHAVPARGDVLLGCRRGRDRYRHDTTEHERRWPSCQADRDQRATDQLDARNERGLNLGCGNAERAEVLDQSAQLAELAEARAKELQPDGDTHHEPGYPLLAIEPGVETSDEIAEVCHVRSLSPTTFAARSRLRMRCNAVRSGGCLTSKRSRSSVAHATKRTGSRTSTAAVVRAPVRKLISPANWPGWSMATSRPLTFTAARPEANTSISHALAPCAINISLAGASCQRPTASTRGNSRSVSVRTAAV